MFINTLARLNLLYPWTLALIAVSLAACSNSSLPQSAALETPAAFTPTIPPAVSTPTTGTTGSSDTSNPNGFSLTSPEVAEGGALPSEYTCDGVSATLALAWSGAPEGTAGYAVIMHHVASPDDIHWYWILYDIPAAVDSLPKNVSGIGILGNNSVNGNTVYAPPCSKGPGEKVYTYTVYALSAQPQLSVPASEVTRAVFLEAIQDITLASAELNVTYTRK